MSRCPHSPVGGAGRPTLTLAPACLVQGLGKRVAMSRIRTQARGGMGIRVIKLNPGDELAAVDTVSPLPN